MTVTAVAGGGGGLAIARSTLPDTSAGCVHEPTAYWTLYKQAGSYAGRRLQNVGTTSGNPGITFNWQLDGKNMPIPADNYRPAGGGWVDSDTYAWESWGSLPLGTLTAGVHRVRATWEEYDSGGSGYRVTWQAIRDFEVCAKTPASAPGSVRAEKGNAAATVSWTAADGNGSPITGYRARAVPGGQSCIPSPATATSCTVYSLTNGTSYTFEAVATNRYGTSPAAVSNAVTPGTPGAPTNVSARGSSGAVAVSWSPSQFFGSTVTGYTVTSDGGRICTTAGTTTCTVSGLTNGSTYSFSVSASSAAGPSAPSPWVTATPSGPPMSPTSVRATPGDGSATLTWSASATDGSAVALYEIQSTPFTRYFQVAGHLTTANVLGLTNGTAYTFTVRARTEAGQSSPLSAASNAVTPSSAPGAPMNVQAKSVPQGVEVTWAPANANGSSITKYTVATNFQGHTVVVPGSATSALFTGLTYGTPYNFTVRATNGVGDGPLSSESNVVTPGSTASPTPTAAGGSTSASPRPTSAPTSSASPDPVPPMTAPPSAAPSPTGSSGYATSARITSPSDGATTGTDVTVMLESTGASDHLYCRRIAADGSELIVNPCVSPWKVSVPAGNWILAVRSVASSGEAAPEHRIRVSSVQYAQPTPTSGTQQLPRVTVAPFVVKFGQSANVTISGTPGGAVDLYIRKNGGSFIPIRYAVQLDGSGRATVPTKPDMNLRFMARDRATGATSAVGGADGLVTVEKYVSINVSRVGVNRYTFSGSINPMHPGAVVHLYRNGQLVRSGIPVSSSRVYSWTGNLPPGPAQYRITSPVTGYNNVSHSPTRSISVN